MYCCTHAAVSGVAVCCLLLFSLSLSASCVRVRVYACAFVRNGTNGKAWHLWVGDCLPADAQVCAENPFLASFDFASFML